MDRTGVAPGSAEARRNSKGLVVEGFEPWPGIERQANMIAASRNLDEGTISCRPSSGQRLGSNERTKPSEKRLTDAVVALAGILSAISKASAMKASTCCI